MAGSIDIELGGNVFRLLPQCGLYWSAQSMLFIADSHFGKEATFRRGGIPVPVGTTNATLSKISEMLRRTEAKRLCILGDMFHARTSISSDIRDSLEAFFNAFEYVDFSLIPGNHDTNLGKLPSSWPIKIVKPGTTIERVSLVHIPNGLPEGADVVLGGHLHPAIRVSSSSESIGKMPCFWSSGGQLVLPAIGEFTGTHLVRLAEKENAWFIAENEIYAYR